ncbi:MAG: TetR/AcrR family transcriptional regulator [Dethiobacter sp.]|nr:TetR/AcrR family transcriptional regulator [Dethiobacter sp.]
MDTNSSFENLDNARQEAIRKACLDEFLRAGYSSASTNAMCKNAGISKGLLFYYFGSKKDLFLYLVDYCTILLRESFYDGLVLNKENIFERMINLTMRKWSLHEKYPLEYDFLAKLLLDSPPDIEQKLIQMKKDNLERSMQTIMHSLDLSDLRPGIDKEKAIELVLFVIKGFKAKNIEKYKMNPRPLSELHDEIMLEMKEYLSMCRIGIFVR